ncbi:MAG: sel1 repeat family protein [Phenylobacterium sp.]|uniref:tetratricopeptide repeat protein n=1 Tax=Phenylobacterium sp. TaxID=1871053 RepID=UPI001A52487A|nr:tetratricopeptide repeat protein [Phenylobacterium sp.]MBL8773197.1 sel1 repeat family protein [Phenylobacterium sp.]
MEARLGSEGARPLASEAASDLLRSLEALGRRLSERSESRGAADADLAAALERVGRRLQSRTALPVPISDATSGASKAFRGESDRAETSSPGEPSGLRLVLAVAGVASVVSVAGAGLLVATRAELIPQVMAVVLDDLPFRPALRPPPVARRDAPAGAATAEPGSQGPDAETYEDVATALASRNLAALPRLTALAERGDAQAQMHLASLYETGGPGVPKDKAAARSWMRRAADGGDRLAMHNLALQLMAGDGGPRDPEGAAAWFLRAAERGVVDSQYNLGLLYEAGRGVDRNLREAYRWFSIAANAGDLAAREKQVDLEARLRPAERAGLDREVQAFRPGTDPAADAAPVIAPATTVAETQALLARQGYYLGPVDGVASPAFRAASAAYLRDRARR